MSLELSSERSFTSYIRQKNDIKEIENMKNERIWTARSENAFPVLGIIEKIMPKGNEIKNSLLTELKYFGENLWESLYCFLEKKFFKTSYINDAIKLMIMAKIVSFI